MKLCGEMGNAKKESTARRRGVSEEEEVVGELVFKEDV